MSLFSFVGNIGNKLFGKESEAPEAIEKMILESELGIESLTVDVKDGVAMLTGDAPSLEVFEKAVLLVGNIQGISEVNAEALTVSGKTVELSGNEVYYTIEKGDTLSKIAQKAYGDAKKFPLIFDANREVIKNADLIFPGQKIRLPKEA